MSDIEKDDREKAENYRGITLLNTSYKWYAVLLKGQKRNWREKDWYQQAWFTEGKGTMDNVYILHKKASTMYVLFVDLKAVLDTVHREKMKKYLKKKKYNK